MNNSISDLVSGGFNCLPHDMRRYLFSLLKSEEFKRFKQLRSGSDAQGYTFKGFDDSKSIFVHIPKAAGVSISKGLYGNLGGGHFMIREYQKAFSKTDFDNYFKFTLVRNPWDRLYSAYCFLKKGGFNQVDNLWAEKHLGQYDSFESFVLGFLNKDSIKSKIHFIPQVDFILSHDGECLVDYIGYFERIEQDYHKIYQSIYGHPPAGLPQNNRTQNKSLSYVEAYTSPLMIEKVAEIYKEDIEFLGYDFENQNIQPLK